MSLALHDETRDALVIVGGWLEEDGTRQPLEGESVVPRSGTVIGYVYETGKYLYVPNIHVDTRLSYAYAASTATTTLLAMPLTNRGRALGVMTVGSDQLDAYSDTDIALFQQLVNQMAVAIDNARAYTQSQRVAQNKTLANEISVQLQHQNDITKMIDLTMKEVGRAIGAKRGRIRLNRLEDADSENGA
jgi:GAF domain-containing protein